METLMLVEKAARSLDEMGRIPFTEEDIQKYIKENLKKKIGMDDVKKAVETLLVSNENSAPMRKCIYKEKKGGYSYLHACSFGVG
jgi:hypothetical protein